MEEQYVGAFYMDECFHRFRTYASQDIIVEDFRGKDWEGKDTRREGWLSAGHSG